MTKRWILPALSAGLTVVGAMAQVPLATPTPTPAPSAAPATRPEYRPSAPQPAPQTGEWANKFHLQIRPIHDDFWDDSSETIPFPEAIRKLPPVQPKPWKVEIHTGIDGAKLPQPWKVDIITGLEGSTTLPVAATEPGRASLGGPQAKPGYASLKSAPMSQAAPPERVEDANVIIPTSGPIEVRRPTIDLLRLVRERPIESPVAPILPSRPTPTELHPTTTPSGEPQVFPQQVEEIRGEPQAPASPKPEAAIRPTPGMPTSAPGLLVQPMPATTSPNANPAVIAPIAPGRLKVEPMRVQPVSAEQTAEESIRPAAVLGEPPLPVVPAAGLGLPARPQK